MKKIVFYINAIHDGGAERVMVNLANHFSQIGYESILVTSFRDKWEYPVASSVIRLSLENEEIKQSRVKRNLSRIAKLRKICKDEKPDILVSFMAEPNFRAILATRGLPVKVLVSVRNDPNKEYGRNWGNFVGKVLLPMADGCVFQTQDAQRWFPEKLQKKSKVIYNAVKEDFFHIRRKPIRGEIVTCGRLTSQKNHKLLINAFADVVKRLPYAVLRIYGDGELRNELREQIDHLGLTDKVFLMGATSDVGKALQTADLFVLSSDYEGMPNALMEAMAAGIPCISTDCPCGGPRELFCNKETLLVNTCDEEELSSKIYKLLGSYEDCVVASEYMKKSAKRFAPNIVLENWEQYVARVIGDMEHRP